MTDGIHYEPTTSWEPGQLAGAEQLHASFRDGFNDLVTIATVALESGRPHAIVAQDLAWALRWMSSWQALTMLATVAVDAAVNNTIPPSEVEGQS